MRALDPTHLRPALPFHSQVVRTGLSPRHLGGLVELPGRSWQILFLEAGGLALDRGEQAEVVSAPMVVLASVSGMTSNRSMPPASPGAWATVRPQPETAMESPGAGE